MRSAPTPSEVADWIADLSAADLRLLVHAGVCALGPVAYAGHGTLRLVLPALVGWGRVDDILYGLPLAIPPAVVASFTTAAEDGTARR